MRIRTKTNKFSFPFPLFISIPHLFLSTKQLQNGNFHSHHPFLVTRQHVSGTNYNSTFHLFGRTRRINISLRETLP
jgi:hypothetical protein